MLRPRCASCSAHRPRLCLWVNFWGVQWGASRAKWFAVGAVFWENGCVEYWNSAGEVGP